MTATSVPAVQTLKIFQGATWRNEIMYLYNGAPFNLSGHTARMQIRASRGSGVTQQAEYDKVLGELTTSNGGIVLNADAVVGRIRLYMSAMSTSILLAVPARYDLELVTGTGEVTRLMMGEVLISEEVSRSG